MKLVGLTGGIGAGKSAVSAMLAARGARVVDADLLARAVVAPGTPGLAALVEEFGEGILAEDGSLDRPALGALAFADDGARARLNGIVHPLVGAATLEAFAEAERDGVPVVVHDVPLLVETGLQSGYADVVVVMASEATRLARLTGGRGMSEADARARMAAQASDDQRREVATVVLDNDGTLEQLRVQVDALWDRLA